MEQEWLVSILYLLSKLSLRHVKIYERTSFVKKLRLTLRSSLFVLTILLTILRTYEKNNSKRTNIRNIALLTFINIIDNDIWLRIKTIESEGKIRGIPGKREIDPMLLHQSFLVVSERGNETPSRLIFQKVVSTRYPAGGGSRHTLVYVRNTVREKWRHRSTINNRDICCDGK